jgi:hypothetical protein
MKSRSAFIQYVNEIELCKNKVELKITLLKIREEIKNNSSFSFFLIKNKSVSQKVKSIYLYNNSIKESVFRILNDIDHDVICQCGGLCRFLDNNRGYQSSCGSHRCIFVNKKRNESSNKTFLLKYGTHPMKTEATKNKLRKSIIDKYSVDSPMKVEEVKQKVKKTNLKKYGVEHAIQSDIIKDRVRKANFEKYGGHPMQKEENFLNNLRSRVKFKNYTLPSGKIIKIQGYENIALDILLLKYKEDDILYTVKDINKVTGVIYYMDDKNIRRRYYPDFYIKSINKIYEAKSIWTYQSKIEKNKKKMEACHRMGMYFEFIICDYKGNRIFL